MRKQKKEFIFNADDEFHGIRFVRLSANPAHICGGAVSEAHDRYNRVVFFKGEYAYGVPVAIALPDRDGGWLLHISPICAELNSDITSNDVYRYCKQWWDADYFRSLQEIREYLAEFFRKGE